MSRRNKTVASKSHAAEYRRGVLVVHGIGKQKSGKTRDIFAHSIVSSLGRSGSQVKMTSLDNEDDVPSAEIVIEDRKRVLLAEAYWADAIPELKGLSLRRAERQVTALLRMFPLLLSASLAPRATEPDPTVPSANTITTSSELRLQAPTLWRMATLYGVVIGLSVLIGLAAARPWLAIILGAIGVVLVVFLANSGLIGQVRVAALEEAEVQPALARIRHALAYMEMHCNEIWIIAHSQGGYLTHRILAEDKRNSHPRVKRFTGLASGLRPIRLAALIRSGRWAVSGWIFLLASLLLTVSIALIFEPGGLISPTWLTVQVLDYFVPIMVEPIRLLGLGSSGGSAQLTELIPKWPAFSLIDGWRIGGVALAILILIIAFRVRREATVSEIIPDLPSQMMWEELASPSDIVGSMSVPPLPQRVRCFGLPGLRNGLLDHLLRSYLGPTGVFGILIAETLRNDRSFSKSERPSKYKTLEQSLVSLSDRTYCLRGLLLVSSLCLTLSGPLMLGGSIRAAAASMFWLYAVVSALAVIGAALWWIVGARSRIAAYYCGQGLPIVTPLNKYFIRLLWILGVYASVAGFAVVYVTQRYPSEEASALGGDLLCFAVFGLLAACLASVSLRPSVVGLLAVPALLFVVLPAYAEGTVFLGGSFSGLVAALWIVPGLTLSCICTVLIAIVVIFGIVLKLRTLKSDSSLPVQRTKP